jgi:flavin reductase (DIM6/NTAB) family NADH-FMN oxidoreductase RutF
MRKLWNRPTLPVWSLVTENQAGLANMNICTYVTSVSMNPKLMLVATYENTATLDNLVANPSKPVLLQLLSEELAPVVRVCGRQSGRSVDKVAALRKKYSLCSYQGLPYFAAAAGVLALEDCTVIPCGGDHRLLVGRVTWSKNLHDAPILTTEYLRSKGFIRA